VDTAAIGVVNQEQTALATRPARADDGGGGAAALVVVGVAVLASIAASAVGLRRSRRAGPS
jgi:hypothetical protein